MVEQTENVMSLSRIAERVNQLAGSVAEMGSLFKDLSRRLQEVEDGGLGSKEVLTIDEAGFFLGYSRGYLYKLTRASAIPFHKPTGKTILFLRSELVEWVSKDGGRVNDDENG